MNIEGIYLNTQVDNTFDNMMSSVADYTGSAKADDAKSFLQLLAAAVERSQVIIAIGPLTGRSGLIQILSKGLGLPITNVDWDAMGIAPIDDMTLPSGAVPLLNDDAEIAGMILENGGQSIIVLDDDAEHRAKMLEMYIEPYIGAKVMEHENDTAPEYEQPSISGLPSVSDTSDIFTADSLDIPAPRGSFEPPVFQFSGAANESDAAFDTPPVYDDRTSGDRIGFIEEEDFILDEELKRPKKSAIKKDRSGSRRAWIPIIALMLVALLVGGYFGYTMYYQPSKCRSEYEELRDRKDDAATSHDIPVDILNYAGLYESNNDMIGWVTVPNSGIDYPVVTAGKKGADYYSKHTFSGMRGSYGTPYTLSKYDIHASYPVNLAIYGNNTDNGDMFSDLEKYLDLDFYKANPVITMNSIFYNDSWKVISVMTMDSNLQTAAVNYSYDFSKEGIISDSYIKDIVTYSAINCADTADTGDKLLTLITPYSKERDINVVVTARFVRENEFSDTDTSGATYNSSVKLTAAVSDAVGGDRSVERYFRMIAGNNAASQAYAPASRANGLITLNSYKGTVASAKSYIGAVGGGELSDDGIIKLIVVNDTDSSAGMLDLVNKKTNEDITIISVPSGSSHADSSKTDSAVSSSGDGKKPTDSSSAVSSAAENSGTSSTNTGKDQSSAASSKATSSSSEPNVLIYDPNFKCGINIYAKNSKGVCGGDAAMVVSRIVAQEMSDDFALEALKAQAVATFTYIVYHGGLNEKTPVSAPMTTPSIYIQAAVQSVIGQIIKYNGKTIDAVYSAMSGGYSADAKTIWGSSISYLKAVESPYEASNKKFKTTVTLSDDEVAKRIKNKYDIDITTVTDRNQWFQLTYDENNTYVAYVNYGGMKKVVGNKMYKTFGMRSPAFTVSYNSTKHEFTFTVRGWGHGVGMSQVGADCYARLGYTYKEILKHFYTGVDIVNYS